MAFRNYNLSETAVAATASALERKSDRGLAKPRSPYEAVSARLTDQNDWVSFPPFHAHVASLVMPNGERMYAPRIRDSEGVLRFLSEPDRTIDAALRVVDTHWQQVCNSVLEDRYDFELGYIATRWRVLDELEAAAHDLTPSDAQTPYQPITLSDLRAIDPREFPKGYPIIVKEYDVSEMHPDIIAYRAWDNVFRNYYEHTRLSTFPLAIIKQILYGSTIPSNFIEYCDEATRKEYEWFMHAR